MSTAFTLFLFILLLIWIIFLLCRRTINTILSWLLSEVVKSIFPQDNLDIEVDDFGYFCVKGVHVSFNKKPIVTVNQILLKFVWDESIFGLKLQSTLTDLILERSIERCNGDDEHSAQRDEDTVKIKGSLTLGINLFSLNRPTGLLKIVPETECLHGSDIKRSDLTSLWLFARNGEALIQKKKNGKENCDSFYKLSVSEGDALVLYNSKMARLVLLFKNAYVTCSTSVNQTTNVSQLQVATSEGLVLMYKFVDGVLTSSHSRLKHTEVSLTPLAISTLENLVNEYVEQDVEQSLPKEKTPQPETLDNEESCQNDTDICEVAFEAENITTNIYSPQKSTHFELKVAVVGLGSPDENTKKWSISVPFELMFFNADTLVKEPVLGSKIKSEGLINPCVLKAEGEKTSHKATKWDVSFHQGILVQIKPHYVNMLESFWKTYKASVVKPDKVPHVLSSEELEQSNDILQMDLVDEKQLDDVKYEVEATLNTEREIFEISTTICEITIEILDAHDQKLLQVAMMSPQLSMCQNLETRSFNFMIATLKGFNCLENIPFFHPTDDIDEGEENIPSLALSVVEELPNDTNKLSFKKFSFGSCNTTVVVEETLIFAVLKDFGLHKKVAQIFFESNEKKSLEKTVSSQTQRFYFDHLELRAVEVILTLLPAIDLPVDLKVIKNNLGIPHQLPPRFENATLNFDAFERNNIQYGSYKYISNDIKKHYLKELGSQSARVLGSMHLLGNISRLKQDIISGFTTLRETGEFITFFRQVTTGVASSYNKFTGSWSDLFGVSYTNRYAQDPQSPRERRHSEPSELDVVTLRQVSGARSDSLQISSKPTRQSKDDSSVLDVVGDCEGIWLNSSLLPDVTDQTDALNWDNESGSSDGEGNLRIPLDLIPRNVRKQLKGQEFLRRLKENLADNEHGEVFACCFKIRKNDVETKLNALLSNRKVFFLKGRPSHESLVLCVKYESLYKAQYLFQDQTHYLQLTSKMKGIRTLSIPSRNPGESPLVRCDNMVIARKVASKINELKKAYDHECIHSQLQ